MKYVLGDSHGTLYRDHFTHIWISAVTMHRMGRDGVESLLPNPQSFSPSDTVVFIAGEVDCRCHVHVQTERHASKDEDAVLQDLAFRYIMRLWSFQTDTGCRVVVRGVVPPLRETGHRDDENPMRGDVLSRKRWQANLNARLEALSHEHVPSPTWAEDAEGMMLAKMSDGEVHISQGNAERASRDMLAALECLQA